MMRYPKEAHKIYSPYFYVIFIVKYRQKVFLEGHILINNKKEKIIELSEPYNVEIVENECSIDHVHLLININQKLKIHKWNNIVKGTISYFLGKKHMDFLQDILWGESFWSPSHVLATTSNVSIDVLKQYIEDQRGRISHES